MYGLKRNFHDRNFIFTSIIKAKLPGKECIAHSPGKYYRHSYVFSPVTVNNDLSAYSV